MTIEIRVPQLPESVSDASIAAWTVKEGDFVKEEEIILELETDKVVLEVPAPKSGIITELSVAVGDTVLADDLLGVIDDSATASPVASEGTTSDTGAESKLSASPSVRKSIVDNNIDASQLDASGKHGRILKDDVEKHLKIIETELAHKSISAEQPNKVAMDREERRVPMTRLRARIAERLVEAQQTAAILTTFNEVDLSEVSRLRKKYQERFQQSHGVKLGFMSFFIKASTEALKRFPEVNARIDGDDIVYQGFYDIGIAVSSERGLVVPILRGTDSLGNAEIEKSIADFAGRARSGHLEMDELLGGTFSITNGGVFGSMLSTPIINPPQSAILGMHSIQQRPVAVDGEVVIRPMMYLALSYDHRLIDGKTAVSFLVKVKELLEDPASLFLEL